MTKQAVISVGNDVIDFTEEEISEMNSNYFEIMWPIFHAACKRYYNKKEEFFRDDLSEKGVAHFKNLVPLDDIRELKLQWERDFYPLKIARNEETIETLRQETKPVYTVCSYAIRPENVNIVSKIIGRVLNYNVTRSLENYFQSHFSINHILFSETIPDPDPITSFRWHKDVGPASQTHIMIYLDDAEETGGRTEFINYSDSEKVVETGYGYGPIANRVKTITDICPDLTIIKPIPRAGDAVIFNATRIFHCGIHPTQKTRKVMFLILQPDFRPWHQISGAVEIFTRPMGSNLHTQNPFMPYYKIIDAV